jgi:hypothetical protein
VKCRLEIEYVPLTKAENLRCYVTAAVRYTENKLRALMGVKSRLSVKDLPDEYKRILDYYFDSLFAKVNRERIRAEKPEYEKLYDAQNEVLSFEGADEIERESWGTTARLVSENEDDVITSALEVEGPTERREDVPLDSECALDLLELRFVKAIKESDIAEIKKISSERGVMPDAFAEAINEKTSENFGDVIIDGVYPDMCLIEDYEEDIEKWLLKITK